jgi:hypothetical protein
MIGVRSHSGFSKSSNPIEASINLAFTLLALDHPNLAQPRISP